MKKSAINIPAKLSIEDSLGSSDTTTVAFGNIGENDMLKAM
jgi:hypothetical protein